ncbi:MAG: hypothetical protein ACLPVY_26935 [Acidimicrobiia bacterium]
MSRRTGLALTAVVAAVTMLASSCSDSKGKAGHKTDASTTSTVPAFSVTPTRAITVSPLYVSTRSPGPTPTVGVDIEPSVNHKLRVGFHEDHVGNTGAQWEAVGRDAVAAATLITGAPLSNREIDFDVTGRLNGLGAGALLTVAVIALIRGDPIDNDVTMIGTINPDGTIGPAGGTPYEISDVVAAHKTRVLVPEGDPDGLDADSTNRVEVTEVSDVYDAYRQFTGRTLPQLPAAANTRLDAVADRQISSKVESWLQKYQVAANDFQSLAPDLRQDLASYAIAAAQDRQRAQQLAKTGSQAGAFQAAVSADALMNAIAQTGQSLPVLLAQGTGPFVSRIKASQSIGGEVTGLVAQLNRFKPQSVSDAGALISAYGDAVDALSLSTFADELFDAHVSTRQQAINDAAEGAIYFDVAGTLADAAGDVFAAGRGLGGAALGPRLDLGDIATFFRLAAEANLSAFQAVVIAPDADALHTSSGAAEQAFAVTDVDYALAQAGDSLISALPSYFGGASTADYARLGGALALYDRTAQLLATYDSLGQVDPMTLQLSGIGSDAAFNSVIGVAHDQLAASVGQLASKNVNSTTAVSDIEIGGVDQDGALNDKFNALGDYWDGYLNSRVLAYLGWFPSPG